MPADRESIRAALGNLGLDPEREEEIVREISEHLADHAASLELGGMARAAAVRAAVASVSDWAALRKEILAAETEELMMNYRTKALWLPALLAVTLSNGLLAMIQIIGPHTHFHWLNPYLEMRPWYTFLIPWLILQMPVGAIAALWSRRAGGTLPYQLLSALAPAVASLGVLVLVPILTEHGSNHLKTENHLSAPGFLLMITIWVFVQALPLLVGAAPFLGKRHA